MRCDRVLNVEEVHSRNVTKNLFFKFLEYRRLERLDKFYATWLPGHSVLLPVLLKIQYCLHLQAG